MRLLYSKTCYSYLNIFGGYFHGLLILLIVSSFNSTLQKRGENWAELTFAKTSGNVSRGLKRPT